MPWPGEAGVLPLAASRALMMPGSFSTRATAAGRASWRFSVMVMVVTEELPFEVELLHWIV